MEQFVYKKVAGMIVLSASMNEFEYKKHGHQEYALGVTLKGQQFFCLDGRAQLSQPNGVMLFHPEEVHDGMAYDREQLDYVMLYVQPELLMDAMQAKNPVRFSAPIIYDEQVKQPLLRLSQAVLNGQEAAYCSELFVDLADALSGHYGHETIKKDSLHIRRAKDMIRANTDQQLRLEDICQALGVTVFQFIRSFKKQTSMPPYQYFLNSKVERAKAIIETCGDVYMAVTICGFFDLTHLNKHFKRIYGLTAFEYANLMIQAKPGLRR